MLWYLVAAVLLVPLLRKAQLRLMLSLAKHRSLAGHARISRLVARFVPYYDYDDTRFFSADDAPAEVVGRRRSAFALSHALLVPSWR